MLHVSSATRHLEVRVLGTFEAYFAGSPLLNSQGRPLAPKTLALVCFLALEQRRVPRTELADLLWPGRNEANLRMALQQLRSCPGAELWLDDGDAVAIRAVTDFSAFEEAINGKSFLQAVTLWGRNGSKPEQRLIAGIEQHKLPPGYLEFWLEPYRAHAYRQYLAALYQGTLELELQGDDTGALDLARKLVRHDPLHESGVQRIMRLKWRNADHQGGLAAFERLRVALQSEGLPAPLPETAALARQVQDAFDVKVTARAKNLQALHTKLAGQATTFMGRELEISEILALLGSNASRLLTLQGASGSGKTRLALEVARRVAERYPDGVSFVPLETLDKAELLPAVLARALGISLQAEDDAEEALVGFLREHRRLVILDNLEQLTAAAGLIGRLATAAVGTILVTSQVRLGLQREQVYFVSGLLWPVENESGTEDFVASDATVLFLQAARRTNPSFQLQESDHAALRKLFRRVSTLPLHLEHLAAWLRLIPLPELLAALETEEGAELLSLPYHDLPERHQRLDRVLEESWQLLPETVKKSLADLSVFQGGFTVEAAREVAATDLLALRELHDHAFVHATGDGRLNLLEAHRLFAAGKLAANPEAALLVFQRKADYWLTFVRQAQEGLKGDQQASWFGSVDREFANIRALLNRAVTEGCVTLGLEICARLSGYWKLRQLWREGADYLTEFLAQATQRDGIHAAALHTASMLQRTLGNLEQAEALLDQAVVIFRELDDQAGLSSALVSTGVLHAHRGKFQQTARFFRQALEIEEQHGDDYGVSMLLLNLGIAFSDLHDYAESRSYMERALRVKRRIGDTFGILLATSSLGFLAVYDERYSEAEPLLLEALSLSQGLGTRAEESYVLITLGWLARELNNLGGARTHFNASLAIAREIDDPVGVSRSLGHLGYLKHLEGDSDAALEYYRQSVPLQYAINEAGAVYLALATLAFIAGQRRSWQRVLKISGALDSFGRTIDARLTGREQQILSDWQVQAQAALLPEDAERHKTEGAQMTLQAVIDVALQS